MRQWVFANVRFSDSDKVLVFKKDLKAYDAKWSTNKYSVEG